MNSIFNWLNGRKTIIGAILLFIASFIQEVIIGKWHATGEWILPTIETLNWLGMAVTGWGLGHKAMKVKPESKSE